MGSPARRSSNASDRYIPNRQSSNLDDGLSLLHQSPASNDGQENNEAMNNLIMSELLGYSHRTVTSRHSEGSTVIRTPPNVFNYKHKSPPVADQGPSHVPLHGIKSSPSTRRRESEPIKSARKIKRLPFKVLDAPALQDDFYLNLGKINQL